MRNLVITLILSLVSINSFPLSVKDIFPTLFPLDETSFKIESDMAHNLSYSKSADKVSIDKKVSVSLDATEFFNSKRYIFTAKINNYSETTDISDSRNPSASHSEISSESTSPIFLDEMYKEATGKSFNLYVRDNGEGYSSMNLEQLTQNAKNKLSPKIQEGLANLYVKRFNKTFSEQSMFRLVESAGVYPYSEGYKLTTYFDTVSKKNENLYICSKVSLCGIKTEFEIAYKVKSVTKDSYVLEGKGSAVQYYNEEIVALDINEDKVFALIPKHLNATVYLEVNRTTGLITNAKYVVTYKNTANEINSIGKTTDINYDIDWKCENVVKLLKE